MFFLSLKQDDLDDQLKQRLKNFDFAVMEMTGDDSPRVKKILIYIYLITYSLLTLIICHFYCLRTEFVVHVVWCDSQVGWFRLVSNELTQWHMTIEMQEMCEFKYLIRYCAVHMCCS